MKQNSIRKMGILSAGLMLMVSVGCGRPAAENRTFQKITQEEAKERMRRDDGHLIVDVRRPDEYAEGHIPGAICIPNETITDTAPQELPDQDQILLIYCRSGNRSRQAAEKLVKLGYTNVYEFGGITEWNGEITAD